MTNYQLGRRAVRAFPRVDHADRRATNRLRRKWMRAIRTLGPKWRGLPVVVAKRANAVAA